MKATANEKPNVLFLFSDQQRWDTCGCYGQRLNVTPNLDRLAQEGVLFEHSFTCQPVCGPARACLQTGRYATETGVFTNHRVLPENMPTIAKELSAQGYDTGYLGKWHLASTGKSGGPDDFRTLAVPPERRGGYKDFWLAADALEHTSHSYDGYMFDADGNRRDFPEGGYRVDVETDWALEFLDTRRNQSKPFFFFISWLEPHHQNDHNHYEGPHGWRENFADFAHPGDLIDLDGDWREEYPDYLACCRSLDQNVGRLRDKLEELGLAENTLIIYTSDHGSHFRTRNAEYKRSCHDGCIRIPLIACGPGFKGGQRVEEMVSLIDLPPTVLKAAGLNVPGYMRGRPLQPLAAGEAVPDWPEEVFLQISENHVGRAIRTNRWKYSVRAPDKNGKDDAGSDVYMEDFLYDLHSDPYERNNLVKDPGLKKVRTELAERLIARMQQAGEKPPQIVPAD